MTLTEEHIVNSVRNHLGLPKTKSTEIARSIVEVIKSKQQHEAQCIDLKELE